MKILTAPLKDSSSYRTIAAQLEQLPSMTLVEGCEGSQKLHLINALSREEALSSFARDRLIIVENDLKAKQVSNEYNFYDRNTFVFPARDLIFYQADLRGREIDIQRMKCFRRLLEGRSTTVVTTLAALMSPQLPARTLKDNIISLEKGGTLEEDISSRLVSLGYVKNAQVGQPGEFAVRGDILDIFDLTEENPYRIELWGDEIESIRSFDSETQRSLEPLDSVQIYPAGGLIMTQERLDEGFERIEKEAKDCEKAFRKQNNPEAAARLHSEIGKIREEAMEWKNYSSLEGYFHYFYPYTETILDLFPKDKTLVFIDEPSRVKDAGDAVVLEFRESMISRAEKGYVLPGQMGLLSGTEKAFAGLKQYRCAALAGMANGCDFLKADKTVNIHARATVPYNKSFPSLEKDLRKYRKDRYRVAIISPSRTRAKRLAGDLTGDGIEAFYSEDPDRVLREGEIVTYYGRIQKGFEYPDIRFAVITETDIFGAEKTRRKKKKRYEGEQIRDFSELKVGDYVVHENHGIGIYRGVEKIEIDHVAKDYLKIEYGGGGVLYVLPTELNVLQKYASAGTSKPKLNKLGSQDWTKTKNRVKEAVDEVAEDLVELYSHRRSEKGHAFSPDTLWQQEFEEMFPFEETQDQIAAIEDTKRDMESDKIMDRLICGDVGYGKTEVALRAAFKAVQDSMQVAILVPTTILAQQHYNTFTERMKDFPVKIEMLSRFRSAAEQKKTIRGLENGTVDIVIGTHRLLSRDVKFKRLGLLVIDEEQRFGVKHKEKIKKLKENVDVLTLTATPIPRTLHMSLVGIRDMSVLEEAPEDRVPIQTYIMEYNEELVREAIMRELSRKGQVYYVYNRISDIADAAARIQQLVPEAEVAFAHGRMDEAELEKIMYDFISGDIDVLVSTTIIETGLDISNVNTIIIHDSDRMGLSQLYQLRGRVGRSGRTAYAFLMYQKNRVLKEDAQKRLMAIREYTDLGSGFRIAMRDLEIRGAGSMLGHAQHGHMAAVGYDLYCKLLNEAVLEAKGGEAPPEDNTTVNLAVDAFIPETYIRNEVQKLEIYKKIGSVSSREDCADLEEELEDRFGSVPRTAENLLRISLIRAKAGRIGVTDITGSVGEIRFTMDPQAKVRVENIPPFIRSFHGHLRFVPKNPPEFSYEYKGTGNIPKDEGILLQTAEEIVDRMTKSLPG